MKTTRDNKQTVNYRHILQKINFTRKSLLKEVYKQLSYSLNRNLEVDGCPSKENLYGQSPSKHSSWWRRTEDVFSVTFFCLPRRLEDIIARRLANTSWRRLGRRKVLRWRRLQDVLENKKCLLGCVINECWVYFFPNVI